MFTQSQISHLKLTRAFIKSPFVHHGRIGNNNLWGQNFNISYREDGYKKHKESLIELPTECEFIYKKVVTLGEKNKNITAAFLMSRLKYSFNRYPIIMFVPTETFLKELKAITLITDSNEYKFLTIPFSPSGEELEVVFCTAHTYLQKHGYISNDDIANFAMAYGQEINFIKVIEVMEKYRDMSKPIP